MLGARLACPGARSELLWTRPVSVLRISELKFVGSAFPGNSLWAWEFNLKLTIVLESNPLKSRCLLCVCMYIYIYIYTHNLSYIIKITCHRSCIIWHHIPHVMSHVAYRHHAARSCTTCHVSCPTCHVSRPRIVIMYHMSCLMSCLMSHIVIPPAGRNGVQGPTIPPSTSTSRRPGSVSPWSTRAARLSACARPWPFSPYPDRKLRVHGKGSIWKNVLGNSRGLLHTLALLVLGHSLETNGQTTFSKLTLSGGPFKTSQISHAGGRSLCGCRQGTCLRRVLEAFSLAA